jgi:transcriptional regulator with XRE-family HTH domain
MPKRFREALLDLLDETKVSLRKVASDSGVSYEALKKLAQREGASMNVDDARLVANALGLTLEELIGDATVSDRARLVAQWMQLSPRERAMLRAFAASAPAPDQTGS